ncbi:VanW family protein [Catenuloplanes japonicus]|uniref:VanW family protein n=1 Tax=Catenuloplanes japonicus TaxID=33876 RepID=UPI000AD9878E|nr:VanW family protein [Catenuloplanes japonicus]
MTEFDDAATVRFARIAGDAPGPLPDVLRMTEHLPDAHSPRRWPTALAGVLVAAVLVGGGGVAWAARGDVPRGTSVLGVDLGGLTEAQAHERLSASHRLSEPFIISLAGREIVRTDPEAIGLSVDVPASVAAATRGGRLIGFESVTPVVTVDERKLYDVLQAAALKARLASPGTAPAITFDGTTPRPVYPEPGRAIDARAAAKEVASAWARKDVPHVALTETTPVTTREEIDRLVTELAVPAVASKVRVTVDRGGFDVPPAVIARSLVFAGDPLTPRIDEKLLRAGLGETLSRLETTVREASVSADDGWPRITGSRTGRTVDTGALARDLLESLPRSGARTITATFTETEPVVSTEDITKLGVTEQLATFTTSGPDGDLDPAAAERLDGALIRPGDTFSLHRTAGRDSSPQLAATLFHAAFTAGLEDVEHRPHTTYRAYLPAVAEATAAPDQDLRFRNDTPYGVLVDVRSYGRVITVTLWGTRVHDSVRIDYGRRSDIVEPPVTYETPGPDCAFDEGSPGFSQEAWRIFRKDGKESKREKLRWTYDPQPRIICGTRP